MSISSSPTVLRLERTYPAPREAVFDAWTNPEVLRRWWAAGKGWNCPLAEVDLREGGHYRLGMQDPESDAVRTVAGVYTEVRRPDRLAYTWRWEQEAGDITGSQETLVEVDFVGDGDATTVVLTHSRFENDAVRDHHAQGWAAVLEKFGDVLA
jgi:uncharacterized protein YndB with AHSA1/START domain